MIKRVSRVGRVSKVSRANHPLDTLGTLKPLDTLTKGFTLIELLVVISAMAIIGTVVFANFANFQKDQNIKQGVSAIQNYFRVAQTNATTRVTCPPGSLNPYESGAIWVVALGTTSMSLYCKLSTTSALSQLPGLTLPTNIFIAAVNDGAVPVNGVALFVAPLYGNITYYSGCASPFDVATCTPISITSPLKLTLQSSLTGTQKHLFIDPGGAVYEPNNQ